MKTGTCKIANGIVVNLADANIAIKQLRNIEKHKDEQGEKRI